MTDKKIEIVGQKQKNVYERIFNVQQKIHTIIKSGTNTFHNYKYAKERDVIAEIKPLLGQERLVITHTLVGEQEVERVSDKGGKSNMAKLTIAFRITNIDNPSDHVNAEAIGYGNDNQDKGAPKAYTMALKYFLSKMFLIETGDDAEEDRGGKKGEAPATAQAQSVFEKNKVMIGATRNVDGLLEFKEKIPATKGWTIEQKKELTSLVDARIDALMSDG